MKEKSLDHRPEFYFDSVEEELEQLGLSPVPGEKEAEHLSPHSPEHLQAGLLTQWHQVIDGQK